MNEGIVLFIIFAVLILFLALGIPVAYALFGLSMIIALIISGPRMLLVGYSTAFSVSTQELYIAIPMFVLMAGVLEFSGIVSDLFDMAYKWFGGFRGGLAIGCVFLSVIIDAISGLGATATVTLGILALPEMLKRGYRKEIALGAIPAGGALGPVIPPSVVMIILGGLTFISIGKLFIAGILPGLLIAGLFSIYIAVRSYLNPSIAPAIPAKERATWKEKFRSLRAVILPVLLIVLVLGSIYSGAATTTEAAGTGALGAFICSAINRRFNWTNIKKALIMTAQVSGMVFWLIIGGTAFSNIMHTTGVSTFLHNMILATSPQPMTIVVVTLLVGIFLGLFVDSGANIMIAVPLFWPIIMKLPEIDPLWWGILYTLVACLGYITPPFGMNLFYLKGVAPEGITLSDIFRSAIPFTIIFLIGIIIVLIFPEVATWLPAQMLK